MFEKLCGFVTFFVLFALITAQDLTTAVVPPRPSTKQNTTITTTIKCFTCYSPGSCLQPKTVICDQSAANSTRLTLAKYFVNVSNVTNPQFECLKLRYTLKKNVQLAVSGCINFGLNPCNLKPKNTTLASASKSCDHCSKSLCNPAGTFSSSLTTLVMSVVFGLLLLKC